MRTLVLLALLAASLTQHIFTPTYLLKEDDQLRQVLLHLAVTNSGKESFCRGLLLAISEDKWQLDVRKKKVTLVVQEILHRIRELVAPGVLETFRSKLEPIVERAAQTWWAVQRMRSRFEADVVALSDDGWEWQAIELNKDGINIAASPVSAADFAKDEAALVVFPRVFLVEEANDTPVFPGVVLRRSQAAAAEREMAKIKSSSPLAVGPPSSRHIRSRRMTFNGTGQSGGRNMDPQNFLGQPHGGLSIST
jgi:hypothetical protein